MLASAALVATFVVVMAWWIGDHAADTSHESVLGELLVALEPVAPSVELAAAAPDPSVRRSVVPSVVARAAADPLPARARISTRPRPEPTAIGWLAVRAIDAVSGEPIRAPRVRAASATRFADGLERKYGEATRLRLTPGDYALHVASPGYEPVEVAAARVLLTETTTLEPILLRPGSGRVVGRADGVRPGEKIRVELRGEGRLACGNCTGRPCARCGWAPEHSRFELAPSGEFAFERLASGAYIVRLLDESDREASAPIRIDLAAAETQRVEIPVARARSVLVALVDVDGTPLDRIWSGRMASTAADPYAGSSHVDDRTVVGIEWRCRFLEGDALVAQGEFSPPSPAGVVFTSYRSSACRRSRTRVCDDRERRAEDELWPAATIPVLEPARLHPFVDGGIVRFDHVPARASTLELRCGAFTATVTIGDARSAAISAQIVRDPRIASRARSYLALEDGRGG